jgi:hypothetical protein
MLLKAYFDHSGDGTDKQRYITLGGLVGPESGWSKLERGWKKTLCKHGAPEKLGQPYFHAREAFKGVDGYLGWDAREKQRVQELARELRIVILASTLFSWKRRDGLIPVSCTIDSMEYYQVKQSKPKLRPKYNICLDWCLLVAYQYAHLRHNEYGDELKIKPFFDGKTTKFYRTTCELQKGELGSSDWWPNHMELPEVVPIYESCAMQAADLLAWVLNRHYSQPASENELWGRLVKHVATLTEHQFLGREELQRIFTDDGGSYKKGETLPRKAAIDFNKHWPKT